MYVECRPNSSKKKYVNIIFLCFDVSGTRRGYANAVYIENRTPYIPRTDREK